MSRILISLISFYQKYLSFDRGALMVFAPGGACRYSPSCSEYTKQMVEKYGSLIGLSKGFRRIISCR